MIDYKDFIIPEHYWNYFVKEKKSLFINSYLREHNNLPSEDIIKNFTIEEKEREDFKRLLYSKYCISGIMPGNPNVPVLPENPDDDIITEESGNTKYDEWFTMVYNVTTITEPTQLFNTDSVSNIGTMTIDGKQTNIVSEYIFNTLGKHEVKVLLKDTTTNGDFNFHSISQLKEISIPSSINLLTSKFLYNCGGIEKIISFAINGPKIYTYNGSVNNPRPTFLNLNTYGTLYIPKNNKNYTNWFNYVSNDYINLYTYKWAIEYIE